MLINKTAYLELSICWQILNELTSQPKQKCYKESGMMAQFVHFTWEGHPWSPCRLHTGWIAVRGSAFRHSLRQNLYIPRTKSGPQKQGDPASHLESWVGRRWPQRPGEGNDFLYGCCWPTLPRKPDLLQQPPSQENLSAPSGLQLDSLRFFIVGVKTFVFLWHCFKSVF